MRFSLTDEQSEIQSTAKRLLAARFDRGTLRASVEGQTYDIEAFRDLAALGWLGIAIEETWGGAGLGQVELAVLAEELGYSLAPVPVLPSTCAAALLRCAGSDEQRERWLPGVVAGTERGTVVMPGAGDELEGIDAHDATFAIVVDDSRATLLEGDAFDGGRIRGLDLTRPLVRVRRVGRGELLPGDVIGALRRIYVTIAAESVGVAQRALDLAVAHARERHQFGRPIGAYQGVSHRCAQMLLETESARGAVRFAAWHADQDSGELAVAASAAKAYAGDAGVRVPLAAMAVLGGIGFTWDHDLHLLLRRGAVNQHLFGSSADHREAVAHATFDRV